jgi:anti-sigma factor RsiW
MRFEDNHLSDQDLLLAADGELSARASARVHLHLAACWTCRARKQEIEGAVGEFVRAYRQTLDAQCPSGDGPRALLKAQLGLLAETQPDSCAHWFRSLSWRFSGAILAIAGLLAAAAYLTSPSWFRPQGVSAATVMVPNPQLTPGATVFMTREQVCRAGNDKNAVVPAAVRRKVFAAYGIGSGAARDYEVDYLITPALGGADDIRNLWP